MVRIFALLVLSLISSQSIAMDFCDPQYIVFIGNPGTGKSALINALSGRCVAKSGLSVAGLTKHLQKIEHDGFIFIDTPGLADIEIQEQAALEIEKSLRFGGKYRIFFVLNIKEGRIIEKDCDTINRVMKVINNTEKGFHIIINKIDELEKELIFESSSGYEEFNRILKNKLTSPPQSIIAIELDIGLKNKTRDLIVLGDKERQFIVAESSAFKLSPWQVNRILTEAAEIKEMKERKAKLQNKLMFQHDEINRLKEALHKETLKKAMIVIEKHREHQRRCEIVQKSPHGGCVVYIGGKCCHCLNDNSMYFSTTYESRLSIEDLDELNWARSLQNTYQVYGGYSWGKRIR